LPILFVVLDLFRSHPVREEQYNSTYFPNQQREGLERLARTEVAEGVVSVVQERFSENLDVGHHNLSISDVEKAVFL
jgi:hypothetical protein